MMKHERFSQMLMLEAMEIYYDVFKDMILLEPDDREAFVKKFGADPEIGLWAVKGIMTELERSLGGNGSTRVNIFDRMADRIAARLNARSEPPPQPVNEVEVIEAPSGRQLVAMSTTRPDGTTFGQMMPVTETKPAEEETKPESAETIEAPPETPEVPAEPKAQEDPLTFAEAVRRVLVEEHKPMRAGEIEEIIRARYGLKPSLSTVPGVLRTLDTDPDSEITRVTTGVYEYMPKRRPGTIKCRYCPEFISPRDVAEHERKAHPLDDDETSD